MDPIGSVALVLTILTFVPPLAPFFLSLIALIWKGRFIYDFLMVAELFPITLIGAGGTIALGMVRKVRVRDALTYLLAEGAGIAILQIYADVSGLAHGETSPTGIHVLVVGILVVSFHILSFLTALSCVFVLKRMGVR